jgi:hypothetical protein
LDTYYVYMLDETGHIVARQHVKAKDDADAVARASAILKAWQHEDGAEVWLRSRLVRQITWARSAA